MKIKELEKWKKKRLFISFGVIVILSLIYLIAAGSTLSQDRTSEDSYWDEALTPSDEALEQISLRGGDATHVSVGTYVENLKGISIKNSNFRLDFLVWFKWKDNEDIDPANNFRIYKGIINKKEMVKNFSKDGEHYQLVRCDATVSKNFWTRRFPLESHQLRFYVESNKTIEKVIFEADKENSGINPSMSISGYDLVRHEVGSFVVDYGSTHGDPEIKEAGVTSEIVTAMEINRSSWGLYVKCFIALVGTTLWVLITLFICTYHRVDPLGMIPAALFGTVSNIMVGANLLPDALSLGLLEYVNAWGIFTILSVAIIVININRIRNKYEDREFATFYGQIMFYTIATIVIAGHIILPLCAYMF